MLRITYRYFRRVLLGGALCVLIGLAILVTLGRIYFPRLAEYQPIIAEQMHQRLGLQVGFSSIRGEWRGLMPMVTFKDVAMNNEVGETIFEAEHVAVSLGLFRSLVLRRVIPRAVSVVKPKLLLARSDSGLWGLLGVPFGEGSTPSGEVLSRFVNSIDVLELSQVSASVFVDGHTERLLNNASLILRQGLFLSELTLDLNQQLLAQGGRSRPSLHLRAEFAGGLFDADLARTYLSLEQADLVALSPLLSSKAAHLPQSLSGELWFDWRRGAPWALQGSLRAQQWSIAGLIGREVLPLASIDLNFFTDGLPNGDIAGGFSELQVQWGEYSYAVAGGSFSVPGSRELAALALTSLDVASVVGGLRDNAIAEDALHQGQMPAALVPSNTLLPAALVEVLGTLQPSGQLHNVHLQLPLVAQVRHEFSLLARAQNLQVAAWNAVPAVKAMDGVLSMDGDSGFFTLDDSSLFLAFPKIFSQELPFAHLAGRIGWHLHDDLEVFSELLHAQGDFGKASATFALTVPLRDRAARAPQLNFQLGVQDSSVKYIGRYTPHILPEGLRSWMRNGIRGGEVSQVGLVYFGSLRKGEAAARTVQLFADVSDGRLRYLPEWPELTELDVNMLLADRTLVASADKASVLGSNLRDMQLTLEPQDGYHQLSCAGALTGPARDLIAVFTDTPLVTVTSGAARSWQARGSYSAQLEVEQPLRARARPEVNVHGRLHDVSIVHKATGLMISGTNGALNYSEAHGLRTKGLRAQLWGQPLSATIGPGTVNANGHRPLRVRAKAPVALSRIGQELGISSGVIGAGISDWNATFDLFAPTSGQSSSLRFSSNLDGVSLDLPQPFAKSADQLRRVAVELMLDANAGLKRGRVEFASLAVARFEAGQRVLRAAIELGSNPPPPSSLPSRGLLISGQLRRLVVSEWLDVLSRYRTEASARASPHRAMPAVAVEGVKVQALDLFGRVLRNPLVDLGLVRGRWQLSLRHPRVTGRVLLPLGSLPYHFDIDHLYWPLGDPAPPKSDASSRGLADVDPGSLPNANVRIADLRWDQNALGYWSFHAMPEPNRLVIRDLKARLGDARISASASRRVGANLSWDRDGDEHQTSLRGQLRAGNLDHLLSQFGLDAGIVSEAVSVDVDMSWNAPPDQVTLSSLSGDIALGLEYGQLRQTSGTPAEALRVLGILNVNYLARRLRLDFSDLYKSGLSYDSIEGTLRLQKGHMHLQKPLEVLGPSSQLTLRGDFDLLSDTIDAELVVSLPLTSNLPWMVALTLPGGIPIAAGVYVAGRIFEQQLESLTSAVYQITGSIDEPAVKFKHLADAGDASLSTPEGGEATMRERRERSGARR